MQFLGSHRQLSFITYPISQLLQPNKDIFLQFRTGAIHWPVIKLCGAKHSVQRPDVELLREQKDEVGWQRFVVTLRVNP